MRQLIVAVAVAGWACGGGEAQEGSTPAVASVTPAVSAAPSSGSGAVHNVDMVLNAQGEYRYVPAALTIKVGDSVRWVNVSGGPHNVQFKANGVPGGAETVLNAAMANRIASLSGPLMIAPNAAYEVSFAGAPTGAYDYTCTPHELLGMNAKLTITN